MRCLYRGDYGPPDPGFDPGAGGGALMRGFEAHGAELMLAQNAGELAAMERQLARGESILWCDQGYAWVASPRVDFTLDALGAMVLIAYLLMRALPLARGALRRGRSASGGAALAAENSELRSRRT